MIPKGTHNTEIKVLSMCRGPWNKFSFLYPLLWPFLGTLWNNAAPPRFLMHLQGIVKPYYPIWNIIECLCRKIKTVRLASFSFTYSHKKAFTRIIMLLVKLSVSMIYWSANKYFTWIVCCKKTHNIKREIFSIL